MHSRVVLFLAVLLASLRSPGWGALPPAAPDSAAADAPWSASPTARLEQEYLDLLVELDPVHATLIGLHGGDATLGPAGAPGQDAARLRWNDFADRLIDLSDSVLSPDDRFDLLLMLHDVRFREFELDSLRVATWDPRVPLGTAASAVYGLLVRDYAPLENRVGSLILRLEEMPVYLDASARLIEDPPRVLVEQALARADAVSTLLLDELPALTADLRDPELTARLTEAADGALESVWRYREFLVVDLLPRSTPAFALGADRFARLLEASEGVTLSLDALRRRAERELDRLDADFRETAARIDANRDPREVMRLVGRDHPDPDQVLATVETAVAAARTFVQKDGIFPLPDPAPLVVRPTPRFSRWGHASLAAPGPFEDPGFPSILYVTLPDPLAPARERAEHLRFFSRPLLRNLAVHEAFPGHGLQAAGLHGLDRPARRAVASAMFAEGWAHYTELKMLERGYREGDLPFRLATLQSGLRRAARFRVALGLHTEGWTLEEAAERLEARAYLEPTVARREAERGMVDPLYLVYTLGRLEVEGIRADLERKEGKDFDLRRFHERLLALGTPPLYLARARLITPEVLGSHLLD